MTQLKPIIKRDLQIKSRSFSLSMTIIVVNAILFVVGLVGCSGVIISMRQNYSSNYGNFMRIYVMVVLLAYLMMLFIAPLYTAGSISGERERGTFDLLLTTNLTPMNIVVEKLASSAVSMFMLVISCLPAALVPLMLGGAQIQKTVFLLIIMMLEMFYILAIGMFASAIGRTVVRSIAGAYAITAAVIFGPILISILVGAMTLRGGNPSVYLMVFDPLLPVVSLLAEQVGETQILRSIFGLINARPDSAFLVHACFISVVVQMAAGFGFIMLSVIYIMPGKRIQGRRKLEKE